MSAMARLLAGRSGFALLVLVAATGGACADPTRLALGRTVFLETADPRCGICHTLGDTGTSGEIGPNFVTLKPDAGRVKAAVSNGIGVMPAFEALTPEQIEALAQYVATAIGGAK